MIVSMSAQDTVVVKINSNRYAESTKAWLPTIRFRGHRRLTIRLLTIVMTLVILISLAKSYGLHRRLRTPPVPPPAATTFPGIAKDVNKTKMGFDHVFVLNMPHRIDRRKTINYLAQILHLEYELIHGYSRDSAEVKAIIMKNNPATKLSGGQIGNYMSHLAMLERAQALNASTVLVLEDDIDTTADAEELIAQALRDVPANWDIIYFGHCGEWKGQHIAGRVYRSRVPVCTHAYAMKRAAITTIIEWFKAHLKALDWETDIVLTMAVRSKTITGYSLFDPIFKQVSRKLLETDIPKSGAIGDETMQNAIITPMLLKLKELNMTLNDIEENPLWTPTPLEIKITH